MKTHDLADLTPCEAWGSNAPACGQTLRVFNFIAWAHRAGASRNKGTWLRLWPKLSRRPLAWKVSSGHEAHLAGLSLEAPLGKGGKQHPTEYHSLGRRHNTFHMPAGHIKLHA